MPDMDEARPTADLAAVIAYADKMAHDLWGDWAVDEGPQTSEAEWQRVRAAARPAVGEGLREALDLLNSLGIVGPNIRHEEQGMWPDGKASEDDTWDGPGWCVCRRPWPCEALALDAVIRAALADKGSPEAGEA